MSFSATRDGALSREECENGSKRVTAGHEWEIDRAYVLPSDVKARRCRWCGAFHPSVPEEVRVAVLLGET
jgi:hypothetical protein